MCDGHGTTGILLHLFSGRCLLMGKGAPAWSEVLFRQQITAGTRLCGESLGRTLGWDFSARQCEYLCQAFRAGLETRSACDTHRLITMGCPWRAAVSRAVRPVSPSLPGKGTKPGLYPQSLRTRGDAWLRLDCITVCCRDIKSI